MGDIVARKPLALWGLDVFDDRVIVCIHGFGYPSWADDHLAWVLFGCRGHGPFSRPEHTKAV